MSRYDRDYYSAREEAEWLTLRVKFYTLVIAMGILTLGALVTVILLGIFLAPEALAGLLGVILMGIVPCFAYSEYGQEFHTERIVRKREQRQEDEMRLSEAKRIVAEFGKGK